MTQNIPAWLLRYTTAFAATVLASSCAVKAQDSLQPPSASEAPIAILVDVTSGQVLHEREPDRRFVPASMTKVMTLFHAFELIDQGALDTRQSFTMRDSTWENWGGQGSTMWLNAGDRVTVDDLLMGIANISANDGSVVLAEGQAGSLKSWVEGMNNRSRELGMTASHFGTPNGWPDEGQTFTTARDLVRLGKALVERHPRKFARYVGKPGFRFNGIEQPNRDPMIGRVSGADGIKTGYTNEAGFGYLGTAKRDGQRLMLVVAGVDRNSRRAKAARQYIEWGFSAFERRRLFNKGEIVGTIRVQNGDERSVPVRTDRAIFVNVPRGREAELRAFISYDGPLRAPFAAGEKVAMLVVQVPGMEPARIPLVADRAIETAGVFARLINGFAAWLS